jgi:hypothetical protein
MLDQLFRRESPIDGILVWNLNLENRSFKLLNPNLANKDIYKYDFRKFTFLIKPCFRAYFLDALKSFSCVLKGTSLGGKVASFYMKALIPIHLEYNSLMYCVLRIIPEFHKGRNHDFIFKLIPIKKYENEIVNIQVCENLKKHLQATTFVNRQAKECVIFTNKQKEILLFLLTQESTSSKQISHYLNKDEAHIKRYMALIKNRLELFFNMKFNTMKEAIIYYKQCFLAN